MRPAIDRLLERSGGVATRGLLLRVVSRHVLDHEIRSGQLVAPFARVYCRPWDVDVHARRAALLSVGRPVSLSHLSALAMWDLGPVTDGDVHVVVPARRRLARQSGLVVHRTRRFPPVHRLDRMIVTGAAASVIASWSLLPTHLRRAPVIDAARRGLASPEELRAALGREYGVVARGGLAMLIGLLESGCESELEIWGKVGVFDAPGLSHAVRQRIVVVRGRRFRLDLAYDAERVGIELDGHQFHSARDRREADMRRDALLATAGWLVLRYSYARLHTDPAGVRQEVLDVLATRRTLR